MLFSSSATKQFDSFHFQVSGPMTRPRSIPSLLRLQPPCPCRQGYCSSTQSDTNHFSEESCRKKCSHGLVRGRRRSSLSWTQACILPPSIRYGWRQPSSLTSAGG